MTDTKAFCPTVDQLKAMIDGSLSGDLQTAVQSHIDCCADCQQTLESMVAVSQSWDAELGHLRDEAAPLHEAVLSDAMRQMKAEEFVANEPMANLRGSLDFLEPSDYPDSIGRLGLYEVTEVVGQGGMGIVLKAFDPALHRVVAVKVLAPYLAHNPQARKRFVREAQAIAAVSHDHVITIHAIDESAEQPKIVMQYVAGRSLQQKIDAEGSLDLKEILRIGMQTASGLAAAHAQGLVHRDVKPSNILLENGIQRVKLTDFGLARAVDDASLTQSGAIAGTPQYMAPEQANGDAVDYRADLFSLGSVLYAMCVGHSPFRASTTMGVLKRVCHDPPRRIQELNAEIPDWLCAIVMKLLAKKPEERFQSAKAVAELLETWLAHVQQPSVVAKPASIPDSTSSSPWNAATPTVGAPHPKEPTLRRQMVRDNAGTTILFQAISGRWLLFFFFAGIAATLAITYQKGLGIPERILFSFITGMYTSFWGVLFVALIRLFWANICDFIPWAAKFSPNNRTIESSNELKRTQSSKWGRLPPESLAMLAAIVMMLLSFNPLLAAIAGIIVWRVAAYYYFQTARIPLGNGPAFSGSSFGNASNSGSTSQWSSSRAENLRAGFFSLSSSVVNQLNRQMNSVSEETSSLLKNLRNRVRGLFSSAATERNRLLISIGWCLVGGVDLYFAFAFGERQLLCPIIWVLVSLISFTVSHCVQVGQNAELVRSLSYLSLIPVSFGSIGRVPLSVITLLWLNSGERSNLFEATPFSQTKLGSLAQSIFLFLGRSLVTTIWLLAWTIGWLTLVAAIYLFLIVPYGPYQYDFYDKSIITLKRSPEQRFELTASGSGQVEGYSPDPRKYRIQKVGFGYVGGTRESQIIVPLVRPTGERIHSNRVSELISKALTELLLEDFTELAGLLSASIERINGSEVDKELKSTSPSSAMTVAMQSIDELSNSPRSFGTPWKGFSRLGSLLNPKYLQVELDTDVSYFNKNLSKPVLVLGLTLTFLGWIAGCLRILSRSFLLRGKSRKLDAVVAA